MMPTSQFPDLMGKAALPALGRSRPPKMPSKGVPKKKAAPKGRRVPVGGLAAALSKPKYNDGDGGAC